MPGLKRQRPEEDGVKINGSKKVKSGAEKSSKADKKFAVKLASRDKSKSSATATDAKKEKKENKAKKPKKDAVSEESEEDSGFNGFSTGEDQMVVDEEDDEAEDTSDTKPKTYVKSDAGKVSSASAALKGSTDGANGMFTFQAIV